MFRRYEGRWRHFAQADLWDGSYDLADPQSLNRYSYTGDDPVNFTDPTGLTFIPPSEQGWDMMFGRDPLGWAAGWLSLNTREAVFAGDSGGHIEVTLYNFSQDSRRLPPQVIPDWFRRLREDLRRRENRRQLAVSCVNQQYAEHLQRVSAIRNEVAGKRPLLPTTPREKQGLALGVGLSMTAGAIVGGIGAGPPGAMAGAGKSGLESATLGLVGIGIMNHVERGDMLKPLLGAEQERYRKERGECISTWGSPSVRR